MRDDRTGRDAVEKAEETKEAVETKRALAGAFGRAAPTYGRVGPAFFAYFGRRLAEVAALRPGERVLDVATGIGAALFPAVDAVGPSGSVVGVDLAEPMVQELTAEIRRRGLANVSARVMDAERLECADGAFDAVLCAFALFFFPRRERALAAMRRVLRPGGRLAVSTWGANDPRWRWYEELVRRTARSAAARARDPQEDASGDDRPDNATPIQSGLDRPEGVREALEGAGFRHVTVVAEEREFLYASEEEWWAAQWSHGARLWLERLTAEQLDEFKRTAFERMQPQKEAGGFPLRLVALLSVGARDSEARAG